MTPFGLKVRSWRKEKNLTQKQQANFLGVSKAYISALEVGAKGRPSAALVDQICVWLDLIWDDAEELKQLAVLSHPKPRVEVRRDKPNAILLANFLAQNVNRLSEKDCSELYENMKGRLS